MFLLNLDLGGHSPFPLDAKNRHLATTYRDWVYLRGVGDMSKIPIYGLSSGKCSIENRKSL